MIRFLKKYKQLKSIVTSFLSVFVVGAVLLVPAVGAAPTGYFADGTPGQQCDLYSGEADANGTGVFISDGETCCPSDAQSAWSCLFAKYASPVVELLSGLVGLVVVVAVIVGGVEYSTSAGDPQRAASGKSHITNALLALIAYAFLYAFLQFIIPGGLLNGG
jgi:hypothetical protein